MRFNSYEYGFFLAIVIICYYLLNPRYRAHLLFIASLIFYMSWKTEYILLILGTLSVCYLCIWQMAIRDKGERVWLILCMFFSLTPLIYFKYAEFLFTNVIHISNTVFDYHLEQRGFNVVLPLGISFYTFQLLSYAIDVYRKKSSLEKYPVFLLYVLFFPQLVAGPIVRSHILIPQLKAGYFDADNDQFDYGIFLILFGLVKKVVFADYLAAIIDPYFNGVHTIPRSGWDCMLLLYAFSFQIYFDFAGYTDIARGSAKLVGIELPINFNFPYVANSVREFWRRWHITLSTWLRDYLYIPLGGSRKGKLRLYISIFITMTIGGLWHGASWTFVLWGVFHGLALVVTRFFQESRVHSALPQKKPLSHAVAVIVTYNLVCFGWLFFRAPTMAYVVMFTRKMFHFEAGYFESSLPLLFSLLLFVLFIGQWFFHAIKDKVAMPRYRPLRAFAYAVLIMLIMIFSQKTAPFIYFQF